MEKFFMDWSADFPYFHQLIDDDSKLIVGIKFIKNCLPNPSTNYSGQPHLLRLQPQQQVPYIYQISIDYPCFVATDVIQFSDINNYLNQCFPGLSVFEDLKTKFIILFGCIHLDSLSENNSNAMYIRIKKPKDKNNISIREVSSDFIFPSESDDASLFFKQLLFFHSKHFNSTQLEDSAISLYSIFSGSVKLRKIFKSPFPRMIIPKQSNSVSINKSLSQLQEEIYSYCLDIRDFPNSQKQIRFYSNHNSNTIFNNHQFNPEDLNNEKIEAELEKYDFDLASIASLYHKKDNSQKETTLSQTKSKVDIKKKSLPTQNDSSDHHPPTSLQPLSSDFFNTINDPLKQIPLDIANDFFGLIPEKESKNARQHYSIGLQYLKKNDPINALMYFQLASTEGHIPSLTQMGHILSGGYKEIPKNLYTAACSYKLAADRNESEAAASIGLMYMNGEGVPRNIKEALRYLEIAAKKNNTSAIYNIAVIYYNGLGAPEIPQDVQKAKSYFEMGAALNDPECIEKLGIMYFIGDGVEKDYAQSFKLFKKSQESGSQLSFFYLGRFYENGLGGAPHDDKLAVQYYQNAVNKGYLFAFTNLGYMYEYGKGVKQSMKMAVGCYQKGVDAGDPDACVLLGTLYETGNGVKQDFEKAVMLFQQAVEKHSPTGMLHLAQLYEKGTGVKMDLEKAFKLYQAAADGGLGIASISVGNFFENGIIVPKNHEMAVKYWEIGKKAQEEMNREIL